MADVARDVPVPGRDAVPALLRQADGDCGVILMHGSAGDMNSGRLPLYTDALAGAGFPVLRFTIKPPHMPTRVKCCQAVLDTATSVFPEAEHVTRWILGGHSMGARVASQCASDNADKVPGVIFSSYPLHPPGKEEELRDEPLASLQLPILFVRGTRDQFCEDGPWQAVRPRLTSPDITVHTVEGGDHGLKVKGGKAADEAAMKDACEVITSFVARLAGVETPDPAAAAEKEPAEGEPADAANGSAKAVSAGAKKGGRPKSAPKPKPAAKAASAKTAAATGIGAKKRSKAASVAKPKAATKAASKPKANEKPTKGKSAPKQKAEEKPAKGTAAPKVPARKRKATAAPEAAEEKSGKRAGSSKASKTSASKKAVASASQRSKRG